MKLAPRDGVRRRYQFSRRSSYSVRRRKQISRRYSYPFRIMVFSMHLHCAPRPLLGRTVVASDVGIGTSRRADRSSAATPLTWVAAGRAPPSRARCVQRASLLPTLKKPNEMNQARSTTLRATRSSPSVLRARLALRMEPLRAGTLHGFARPLRT